MPYFLLFSKISLGVAAICFTLSGAVQAMDADENVDKTSASHFQIQTTTTMEEDDSTAPHTTRGGEVTLLNIPTEVFQDEICPYLSMRDLDSLYMTCLTTRGHIVSLARSLGRYLYSFTPHTRTQMDWYICVGSPKLSPFRHSTRNTVYERLKDDSFKIIRKCHMRDAYYPKLVAADDPDIKRHLLLSTLLHDKTYEMLHRHFYGDSPTPKTHRLERAALYHMLSRFRVLCLREWNKDDHQEELLEQAQAYVEEALNRYSIFSSEAMDVDFSEPYHIVMALEDLKTLEGLKSLANHERLQKIFQQNPDHILVLDANEEVLSLRTEDLPNTVHHLAITNVNENIKSTEDSLLSHRIKKCSLRSFDTSGLNNLTTIGYCFLSTCTSLNMFDTSGLANLTTIGDRFLYGCTSLTIFDTSGLTSLNTIKGCFLSGCTSLTTFDTSGLTNLTNNGYRFLSHCTSLTTLDTSGLTSLTTIEWYSFSKCISLTTFDTSGLTKLTNIGTHVLWDCTSLTTFDTSRLTSLTTIGDCFLSRCKSLTSFDTSGLNNLTTIGDSFLFNCTSLTTFDPKPLINVESLGAGCFQYCDQLLGKEKIFDSLGVSSCLKAAKK